MTSYSYMLSDLVPGKFYNVLVQAFCGENLKGPSEGPMVNCLVTSEMSNSLDVTPTAAPSQVRLRLAAVHDSGFDVTWSTAQQFGDATLSGYQLVRDGHFCRDIIAPDVTSYRVDDITIGETVTLQLVSLTNHPVGKYSALYQHPDYTMDQPQREFISNNLEDADLTKDKRVKVMHRSLLPKNKKFNKGENKCPACKPGPAFTFKYTGLVKPVSRIWTEKTNGFSTLLKFQTSIYFQFLI